MTSAAFSRLPFLEQIAYFRGKVNVATAAWTDVWGNEHDTAFVVAGAARDDLLADLRAAVDRAISEGTTLQQFRRDFDAIIARTGWAYNGGRNWRTRVIYDTNLRTSYAAGREAQMADPALRRRRPYGLYRHGGSRDPRPEHLRLDGLVLRLDHPWWASWSPPNGWGCSCKKFMISERDAERLGLEILDEPPAWSTQIETVTVGTRGPTPRTVDVPAGIDPGFAHRPGDARIPRGGVTPPPAPPPPRLPDEPGPAEITAAQTLTIDEMIDAGREFIDSGGWLIPGTPEGGWKGLKARIMDAIDGGTEAAVANGGAGAALVRQASARFPKEWVAATDAYGRLRVLFDPGRAFQLTIEPDFVPGVTRVPLFNLVDVEPRDGFISANSVRSAVHEYAHRVQHALPGLDAYFQQLHRRRTGGEDLERLSVLTGNWAYRANERARPDDYINPYFGKEYPDNGTIGGALEVMTMTFERVLGDRLDDFAQLAEGDRELLELAIGLLLRWRP